jgi:NAD(P)-dependent dehydrogenase (short-subunit alcohol dehydrogenase family)
MALNHSLTVLVIGASRGIGLEFVRQYIDAGDRVIATARDADGIARLQGLGAQALKLDVANPASVSGLSWQLDGEKIDIALYVAGVYSKTGATTPPTQQEFDHVMHTNVLGAMQAIPQVAPWVEEANGKFAFITSGMGQIGEVESSLGWTYRVSKAALNMAVAAAQNDYAKATFIALCPGWVQTDMGGASAPLTVEESVSAMRKTLSKVTNKDSGRYLHHDGQPYSSW